MNNMLDKIKNLFQGSKDYRSILHTLTKEEIKSLNVGDKILKVVSDEALGGVIRGRCRNIELTPLEIHKITHICYDKNGDSREVHISGKECSAIWQLEYQYALIPKESRLEEETLKLEKEYREGLAAVLKEKIVEINTILHNCNKAGVIPAISVDNTSPTMRKLAKKPCTIKLLGSLEYQEYL